MHYLEKYRSHSLAVYDNEFMIRLRKWSRPQNRWKSVTSFSF